MRRGEREGGCRQVIGRIECGGKGERWRDEKEWKWTLRDKSDDWGEKRERERESLCYVKRLCNVTRYQQREREKD